MIALCRFLFFGLFARFFVLFFLGLNVRRSVLLPKTGPALIVANHNSHLDTLVLMTLYPLRLLPNVRPVAAADYFFRNKYLKWFSLNVVGIIPIERKASRNLLEGVYEALDKNAIVIFYPEGSRGEPEQLTEMKRGIAKVAEAYPDVPITPIFMHGLGKALPKGDWMPVPFFCDVFIGEAIYGKVHDTNSFMQALTSSMNSLSQEKQFAPWE